MHTICRKRTAGIYCRRNEFNLTFATIHQNAYLSEYIVFTFGCEQIATKRIYNFDIHTHRYFTHRCLNIFIVTATKCSETKHGKHHKKYYFFHFLGLILFITYFS